MAVGREGHAVRIEICMSKCSSLDSLAVDGRFAAVRVHSGAVEA
jgi:hypothetical protein